MTGHCINIKSILLCNWPVVSIHRVYTGDAFKYIAIFNVLIFFNKIWCCDYGLVSFLFSEKRKKFVYIRYMHLYNKIKKDRLLAPSLAFAETFSITGPKLTNSKKWMSYALEAMHFSRKINDGKMIVNDFNPGHKTWRNVINFGVWPKHKNRSFHNCVEEFRLLPWSQPYQYLLAVQFLQ